MPSEHQNPITTAQRASTEFWHPTGEFDVMLLVRAQDNNALRRIVPDQLQNTPSVLSTKTFLIFEDAEN
ncbi:Lrp/AsnC ligand binding domain-containing protein [Lentzea indica]|nr:Lrp/AsnC ligand binding domain-containing protein [Lentzea indica]